MTIEGKVYGLEAQVTVSSKLFTWDRLYIEWGRICKNKTGDTTRIYGNKSITMRNLTLMIAKSGAFF